MFEHMETEDDFIIEQKIHPIHNENFVDVKSCDLPLNHNQEENELESIDPLTSVKEETIENQSPKVVPKQRLDKRKHDNTVKFNCDKCEKIFSTISNT